MNDISVKIVESPKGCAGVGEASDVVAGSDVDPLAIEDDLKTREQTQQESAPEKAGSYEDAKDEVKLVEAEVHQNGDRGGEGHTVDLEEDPIANALAKLEEGPKETEEPAHFAEENSPTALTFEEPTSIDTNDTSANNQLSEPQLSVETSKPLIKLIQQLAETSEPLAEIKAPLAEVNAPLAEINEELRQSSETKRNTEDLQPSEPQLQTNRTITESLSEPLPEPSEHLIQPCELLKSKPLKPTQSLKEPSPDLEPEVKLPSPEPENQPPEIESVVIRESTPIPVEKTPSPKELKEPSPEPESTVEAKPSPVDVEMLEVKEKSKDMEKPVKVEKKEAKEIKVTIPPVNGDISKEEQSTKRRASADIETDSPLKRLCQEVERTFPQHDSMINDFIQTTTKNNLDEIQRHTEQLLAEIQTLRELAQKKEHEWNNILHLKKVKEEILLRLLRRKQVLSFEKAPDINGSERTDPYDFLNQAKNLAIDKSDEISGLSIKQPGSSVSPMMQQPVMPVTGPYNPMSLPPPYDKAAHMHQTMPKPVFQPMMMHGMPGFPRHDMNGQLPTSFGMPMGRQGPTKDVKSIIADYRQRNPEITPRRGRRMKSILNPNILNQPRSIAPKMDAMNNLNNLNMLFNNLDMNQKAMLERLQQMQAGGLPNSLFKDALVQYASMQQANAGMMPGRPAEPLSLTARPEHHPKERRRPEKVQVHEEKPPERLPSSSPRLPPPPYPEISLLPVTQSQDTQNSLLHGILTKAPPTSQGYTPTLAKLLTSPERRQSAPALPTYGQAKNCGEITITPVQPTPPPAEPQPEKPEEVVQLDDEESPASEGEANSPAGSGSGRLVIDEGTSEAADTPLCQGCRRKDAQFVCAGCANQWYCSRDCQVAAWDEHSEMCSG